MAILKVKRGRFATMPTLMAGEFGWCTDTQQLFMGTGAVNIEIVTKPYLLSLFGPRDLVIEDSLLNIKADNIILEFDLSVFNSKSQIKADSPILVPDRIYPDNAKMNMKSEELTLSLHYDLLSDDAKFGIRSDEPGLITRLSPDNWKSLIKSGEPTLLLGYITPEDAKMIIKSDEFGLIPGEVFPDDSKIKVISEEPTLVVPYDIDWGDSTGTYYTSVGSGNLYTPLQSGTVPHQWSAAGTCEEITFYNTTTNGRLRIWTGEFYNTYDFMFDSYTEVVDVGSLSTGWVTLTAPTDFTAFSVTSSTQMVYYSSSTNTTGLIMGRANSGWQAAFWNATAPPYSGDSSGDNLTFSYSSKDRLMWGAKGYAS